MGVIIKIFLCCKLVIEDFLPSSVILEIFPFLRMWKT